MALARLNSSAAKAEAGLRLHLSLPETGLAATSRLPPPRGFLSQTFALLAQQTCCKSLLSAQTDSSYTQEKSHPQLRSSRLGCE